MFLKDIPAETIVETRPRAGILRQAYAAGGSMRNDYGGGRYGGRGYRSAAGAHGDERRHPRRPGRLRRSGSGVRHAKIREHDPLFDGDGERTRIEIRSPTPAPSG